MPDRPGSARKPASKKPGAAKQPAARKPAARKKATAAKEARSAKDALPKKQPVGKAAAKRSAPRKAASTNAARREPAPGTESVAVSAAEPGTTGGEVFGGALGDEFVDDAPEPIVQHPPEYLKSLMLLLVAATFFEGYDGAILALVLSDIRDTFGVGESQLGVSRAIIELGLGAAFFLARAGDRWGRKKLLLWSVLGYTVMTTLTAFSWDLWSFTAFQSLSRVFLGAEYAVAITMIVEEFPKERRARAIGTLLMCSAIGAVAVALMLLGGVASGPLEWRTLYLVGVVPLLFLAFFRRRLKETRRFQEHADAVASGGGTLRMNFFEPWRPQFRRTLVLVGVIHLLRSLPLFAATAWFFYYAEREAGLSSTALYVIFIFSYGFGTIGYLVCGRLMDRYGRRPTAIGYGIVAAVSSLALFQARGPVAIGGLLVVSVFFGLGMAPVLGAISTELFPTYIRNQAAAWARNIFEIAGFILGPLLVGVLGDHYTGTLGSVGDTVSLLLLLFLPATWLIWRHLPETKGRELEEIEADLGIDDVREQAAGDVRSRWKPWAAMGAAALVLVVGGGLAVAALGDITRRPEGAAERFLQAVDGDEAENIETFGGRDLAVELFGEDYADSDFDKIEVSQATDGTRVPFRVEVEDADEPIEGVFTVAEVPGTDPEEYRVLSSSPPATVKDSVRFDTSAPAAAWPIAIAVVVILTLVSESILRALKAAPR